VPGVARSETGHSPENFLDRINRIYKNFFFRFLSC